MKYLRNDLREEYERIAKNVPDIEDLQHPLINFSDVLHAYFILADYFTDESSDKNICWLALEAQICSVLP